MILVKLFESSFLLLEIKLMILVFSSILIIVFWQGVQVACSLCGGHWLRGEGVQSSAGHHHRHPPVLHSLVRWVMMDMSKDLKLPPNNRQDKIKSFYMCMKPVFASDGLIHVETAVEIKNLFLCLVYFYLKLQYCYWWGSFVFLDNPWTWDRYGVMWNVCIWLYIPFMTSLSVAVSPLRAPSERMTEITWEN